uniref:Sushi domain-containing protein n=1 Tax=Gongylonema pulchrum TaxID=637853 RepID=A0A183D0F1_9BILA
LGVPLPLGGIGGLSCGVFAAPVNGIVTYSTGSVIGPFPAGTVATIVCNPGFTPIGITSSTCMNGVWSPSLPGQCVVGGIGVGGIGAPLGTQLGIPFGAPLGAGIGAPCAPLPAPINGQISYSNGLEIGPFPSGTTATVVCNENFVANGLTSATCINGAFSPIILSQCIPEGVGGLGLLGELQCAPLADPPYGELTYSEPATPSYPSRTIATLVCNLGFIASGAVESTCINGQWQPPAMGVCQQSFGGLGLGPLSPMSSQCMFEIPAVANGQIRYSTVRIFFFFVNCV